MYVISQSQDRELKGRTELYFMPVYRQRTYDRAYHHFLTFLVRKFFLRKLKNSCELKLALL